MSEDTINNCINKLKNWQKPQRSTETLRNYKIRRYDIQNNLNFAIRFIVWIKIRKIKYENNFPELNDDSILNRLEYLYYKH